MKHPKKVKRVATKAKPKFSLSLVLFSLFILFITIFATVAFVQQSLEIRQFAQVANPTPTVIPEMSPEPDPTNTPVPDPTEEPTPDPTDIPEPTAVTPTIQNPEPTTSNPTPTDEPQPTSTPSISPTPVYRCNVSCTGNDTCPKNLFCASGVCRNPSCSKESDCVCTLPTNTPRPVAYVSPKKTISPTVKMPQVITPTVAFLADKGSVTPRPTPDFEIFKVPDPPKKSVLQLIIGFIADAFCKVFGC